MQIIAKTDSFSETTWYFIAISVQI